jgi:amino acid adenylation domain-containing protein
VTEELLHRRVARVAADRPKAPAVSDGAERCDYQTLWRRAGDMAAQLRALGNGPDGVVLVCADKCVDVVVAALAAWRNGAAYLPVDPRTPRARVVRAVRRLPAASALVTTSALADRAAGLPVLLLDGPRPPAADTPEPAVSADDLAYLIHTSGSTGEPKLVGVTHRSLAAAYDSWNAALNLGGLASHLQAAPLGFDVHVADLARALLSGAHLVLCPAAIVLDPQELYALMNEHCIEAVLMTPSVWRLLLDWLERTGGRLSTLRQLAVGGESWTPDELRRLRAVAPPGCRLLNFYGVAEACVDSSYADLSVGPIPSEIPLGRPFDGMRVMVLDRALRPVLPGSVGEIYMAGPGLAQGYYRDPARTAMSFLPVPHGPPGARMYRTGDLAQVCVGGDILYRGRTDDQVKVRGTRIQLAEVDAALRAYPGVSAASAAIHRRGQENVLVGYVVADHAISARGLCRHVASLLPEAMVPVTVVQRSALPLSRNGKVDRGALPDPASGAYGGAVRELGGVEALVARHWERLLGGPPRRSCRRVTEAGGTSLTAAHLAVDIGMERNVHVPVGAVFSASTFAGLATAVEAATARTAQGGQAAPARVGATPNQARIWLVTRLRREDAAYHIPLLIDMAGDLDVRVLRECLRLLTERHDGLRAVFGSGPDGLVQRLRPAGPAEMEELDLRAEPQRSDMVVGDQIARSFDVADGPLLRAALLRLAGQRWRLLLVAHHLVLDGRSVRILARDLGRLYSSLVAGRERPQIEAGSYERAVEVVRRTVVDPAARGYWRDALASPPPHPRFPGGRAAAGSGRRSVILDSGQAAALRAISRQYRTTLFAALLAVLAGLLHRWSGLDEVTVGAPFGDQDSPELQDVVGMFVATVALRVSVTGRPAFGELLARTARAVAGAMAHRDVPFDQIVHDLGLSGTTGGNPLFRVWLNMLGPPVAPPRMTGLVTEVLKAPPCGSLFDLCLYVTERGDELELDLVYDLAAIDDAHAQAFLDQFAALAAACAARPLAAIGDHDLRAGKVVAPDLVIGPVGSGVPALLPRLAEVIRDGGDRTAVRSNRCSYTYRELGTVAGQVAAALTEAGASAGTIVPVLADRHPELVPALLGVLSADAVFTVIDAALPTDRIRELVALTGARVGLVAGEPAAPPVTFPERDGRWLATPAPGVPTPWTPAEPAAGGYLAFTSGTTGRPSRVRADTAPLAHFLAWYTARFGVGPDDRFALTSGLGYDPLLRDVLTPLWVGATLSVPDGATSRTPRALLAWLATEQITVLHLTPQLARLLTLTAENLRLPRLRLVCCGGDQLHPADVAGIRTWAGDAVVMNAYGTTETPQIVALQVVDSPSATTEALPIGRATPGAHLLIRNPAGRPAAVGEVGRLLVRGPYLASTVLDGNSLIDDAMPGYRQADTGDLARYLADGAVQLLGRGDDLVKVAGHRVNPLETDQLLRTYPAVRDAVTLAVRGADGENHLRSYVVAEDTADPDALRALLRRSLPDHLVPVSITCLESLPLNGNGKVDRTALAGLSRPTAAAARPGARPLTDLERRIAAAWERVHDVPVTGTDLNFFDLGGSSLTLLRVQIELERSLGTPVAITDLFEHPTVAALAAYLSRAAPEQPSATDQQPVPPGRLRIMRERRLAARNATRLPGHADAARLPEHGERN